MGGVRAIRGFGLRRRCADGGPTFLEEFQKLLDFNLMAERLQRQEQQKSCGETNALKS